MAKRGLDAAIQGQSAATAMSTFDQFLDGLVSPKLSSLTLEEREIVARTTGTILVGAMLVLLHWGIILVFMAHSPNISPYSNYTTSAALFLVAVLYLLSRSSYFRFAAVGAVATAFAIIFLSFALDPRQVTADIALRFLVVPTALSCILMTKRATLVVIAASVVGVLVISFFNVVKFDVLMAIAAFVLFGGLLILTAAVLAERRQRMKLEMADVIRRRDARYGSIFNATSDAIAVLCEGRIQEVNAALERLLGRRPEQLIGASCASLGLDWEEIAAGRQVNLTLPDARGEPMHLELRTDRLPLVENSVVVVMRDLRDRRIAAELKAQQLQAEAANAAKTRFLAYMSHELRTPLTSVVGFAALALEQCGEERPIADFLERIHRNGTYLMELVEAVLDLSQIEVGRFELRIAPCSPMAEVEKMISLHRDLAQSKGLEVHVSGELPAGLALDARRFRQIIGNLLHNGLKYTEQGGVHIGLGYQPGGSGGPGLLTAIVTDSGAGFSEKEREYLFQPYLQDARKALGAGQAGVGLGLALSHNIAQSLGGTLVLSKTQPGQGSEFTLSLPVIGRVSEGEVLEGEAFGEAPLKGLRLLVADDNDDIRQYLVMLLTICGAEAVGVVSGREALAQVGRTKFDLILMDLQMDDIDGIAATKELRRRGLRLPIIALTGHALADFQRICLEAGCSDYLPKPISKDMLIRKIKAQLNELH